MFNARIKRAKQMTAVTQVHYYLKEHHKPGDVLCICEIIPKLQHLTYSSISAALWILAKEGILLAEKGTGAHGANEYLITNEYMTLRGNEAREAPEPGLPRRNSNRRKEQ